MNGWFAMSRAMFDHPIFKERMDRVGVWAWMISAAAWKDTRQDANGKTVTVKRGQLLTSYRQMSRATGMGVKGLRILLERLEGETAVGIDKGTGRMLITISNYEKYQSAERDRGTGRGTGGAQEGHTKGTREQDITLEPNGSSDAGASDLGEVSPLSKALWDVGVRILVRHGTPERQARSIIGKWRKQADDATILGAIDSAWKAGTQDPVPYITEALKPQPTQRSASDIMKQLEQEGRA